MIKCPNPKCGSTRVSRYGDKWKCDICKTVFTRNSNDYIDFDNDNFFAQVEQKRKEREAKGIYYKKSHNLLEGCDPKVLNILYGKYAVSHIRTQNEKLKYIAGNYPTKDIENAIKEAKEQCEREERGIYLEKNLDLLRRCNAGVLRIIYGKFIIPNIGNEDEKLNYIAINYPPNDIKKAIKEAEDQIKREKEEEERLERIKLEREKERLERIRLEREKVENGRKEYLEKSRNRRKERGEKERLEREKIRNELIEKSKSREIIKLKEEIGIFENSGRYVEAIECYDKIIELDSSNEILWKDKGNCYFDLERYEEAIECYNKAIQTNPSYEGSWNNKGNTLLKLKRYEEAIECYNKTIELDSSYYNGWYGKALCLSFFERYEEAIECYSKAIELNPSNEYIWYNKALCLNILGRYVEAIECYDKVLAINPSNKDALVCLEKLEREKEEEEQAERKRLEKQMQEESERERKERLEKGRRKREEKVRSVRMYKCPRCGNPLYKKDNIYAGQFYHCEHCGYIKSSWDTNHLKTSNFSASTLNRCPRCGGAIIQKLGGPRGIFYGCVNYPICDFAYSSSDQNVSQTFTDTITSSSKSYSNEHYNKEYRKKFNPKPEESYIDYLNRIERQKVQKKQTYQTNPYIGEIDADRYYKNLMEKKYRTSPLIRETESNRKKKKQTYQEKIDEKIGQTTKINQVQKKSQNKSKRKNELYEYLNNFDNVKNKVMIERRIKVGEITTTQEIDKILIFEKPKTNEETEKLEREMKSSSANDLSDDQWAVACCIVLMILFFIFSASSGG